MSGIRSFKRRKQTLNATPKPVKTKLTHWDGIVIVSLALTCFGLYRAGHNYSCYTDGIHESVVYSAYQGTYHVNHEDPGNPIYKEFAIYWIISSGVGLVVASTTTLLKTMVLSKTHTSETELK